MINTNKKTVISFGEILWDMLPSGSVLGGAPFNFAYRMHSIGHTSFMVSRLGNDDLGSKAWDTLQLLGMDTRFIQRDGDHPTGTVDIVFDERNQPDYTINPHVAYDFIEPNDDLLNAASHADCICFGTLAQRNTVSQHTLVDLLDRANQSIKLLDINLRKDCFNQTNIVMSLQAADILKLNEEESRELPSIINIQSSFLVDLAKKVIENYTLQLCLITLGERGVLAITQSGEVVYEPGFVVTLIDPCGSGDAFTAAFMDQWFHNQPLAKCCRYGNALGAMAAAQAGATVPILTNEIAAFLSKPPKQNMDETLKSYLVI